MIHPVLTVTLNPAVDKLVRVKNLALGQDHRVVSLFRSAGGKGINVARALTHLGVPTRASGVWGGPAGAFLQQVLEQEKIPADFLRLNGETRTSLTILDQKTKTPTRVLEPGPVLSSRKQREFCSRFSRLVRRSRVVVLSGRNAHGAPDNFYARLVRTAKQANRRVILDTSGTPLMKGTAAGPFMIKPNLAEAQAFFDFGLGGYPGFKSALMFFLRKGVRIPVISLGPKGAVASDGRQFVHAQPPRIKVSNAVGCGDALVAGFIFALLKGADLPRALQTAVACGTVNAMNDHPGLLKSGNVRRLSKDIRLRFF